MTSVFAVGSDCQLIELEFTDTQSVQVLKSEKSDVVLGTIVLARTKRVLLAATASPAGAPGTVKCYQFPLALKHEYPCLVSPLRRSLLFRIVSSSLSPSPFLSLKP